MQKQNLSITYGATTYNGFSFEDLPLAAALQVAIQQIDSSADQARAGVVGDALRVVEYQMAEDEARAFEAAGFEGAVPATVQATVDAEGVSPQSAAESILAEADAWRGAMCKIRAARLTGKQAVLGAATHADAERLTDTAIAEIRASVAGVVNG